MAKGKIVKLPKEAKRAAALILDKHQRGTFIKLMLDAEDTLLRAKNARPRERQGQ